MITGWILCLLNTAYVCSRMPLWNLYFCKLESVWFAAISWCQSNCNKTACGNLIATRSETQICLDERRTLFVPLNSVVLLFEREFQLWKVKTAKFHWSNSFCFRRHRLTPNPARLSLFSDDAGLFLVSFNYQRLGDCWFAGVYYAAQAKDDDWTRTFFL